MARPRREEFTPALDDYRRQAHLTQEHVAERVGISVEMVRRHERGIAMPAEILRQRYCDLYGATEEQLGFRPPARDSAASTILVASSVGEDISDIMERVRSFGRFGSDEIRCFELAVDDVVGQYESAGPVAVAPLLTTQRRQLEKAIDECRHPILRQRLFRAASQTSGLLAYMAVNRGRFPLARAYCVEAMQLGEFADDLDLQAWIKGTESFCEYYAGDYVKAVGLAREGLRFAGSGPQSVRLLINGEARALGKLGEVKGVHTAVDRAYALLDNQPAVPGVSPCVSFGGYSRSRLASNAVTAYVDLGLPDSTAFHAEQAMDEFDTSDSVWSQSLIRLDLANSLAKAKDGDPVEAAGLVSAALTITATNPIASVVQRSRSFVRSTSRWRGVAAVDDAHELVRAAARLS